MESLHGRNFIGNQLSRAGEKTFNAFDPTANEVLPVSFYAAQKSEIDNSMSLATNAFVKMKNISQRQRADFLDAIASEIIDLGEGLIERAMKETGLPQGRLEGERGRTCGQLKMFSGLLREGSWVEASIDTAQPERQPLPKPDIRKMLRPIGPVVVFGASNFPLAFSVAGGDTASAFAAGNPVIVKAHPAHPGTSELIASAILKAAQKTDMPDGIFSMLHDSGFFVGQELVTHPITRAVGFTGSFAGGKALYDLVQNRTEPIPFFGEMSATNPVLFLPSAQINKAETWANTYAASLNLGAGQFCTNPGIAILMKSSESDRFLETLRKAMENSTSQTMLSQGIAENYQTRKDAIIKDLDLNVEAQGSGVSGNNIGTPVLTTVPAHKFIENPRLADEIFGPFGLVVIAENQDQLSEVIDALPGQLTGTIIGETDELNQYKEAIDNLSGKVGRLIFNGMPTGVEVCYSMHHGGPYPASTDSRFTSVGTSAIKRFVRPIAFQSCPEELLPVELADHNPLGIWRIVDGNWTKDNVPN